MMQCHNNINTEIITGNVRIDTFIGDEKVYLLPLVLHHILGEEFEFHTSNLKHLF